MEGYIYLGSTEMLGSEVATAFTAELGLQYTATLKDVLCEMPDIDEKNIAYSTPQELIKMVPAQDFSACVRKVIPLLFSAFHDLAM